MTWISELLASLRLAWSRSRDWLADLLGRGGVYRVERIDDEPERPAKRTLYVIEDAGRDWAAVLTCPGGCGQLLHMNLIPDSTPVWRLTVDPAGAPTLHPSVWRREGCGCHFVLKQGRVHWC
jgi:hypothetical protein